MVKAITSALVYDRAGLGLSDPAPQPRTIQDAVDDLQALLRLARVPGPYLLVGHSFGGLILRMYADQNLQEVAGLLLLDVPHPELPLRELSLVSPPSPGEPSALTSFRNHVIAEWNDPSSNQEGFDIARSARQVLQGHSLGDLPLVVITAGQDEWEEGFPTETAQALEQDWMATQRELLLLSTNSRHIIASESMHAIQDYQPELVIETIRQMLARG